MHFSKEQALPTHDLDLGLELVELLNSWYLKP